VRNLMSASIASVCSLVSETKKTMKEDIRTRGKFFIFLSIGFPKVNAKC
jgi:hypothetical protein